MRKWNAVLTAGILLLFLLHSIAGGFQLAGLLSGGQHWLTVLTWVMLGMTAAHAVIGCILTVQTLHSIKHSGTSYYKENRLFWMRRSSGLAVMLLLVSHVLAFQVTVTEGAVRLPLFGNLQLALQLLLVIAVGLHVLTNVKPLMIGLGAVKSKAILPDLLVILAVLLAAAGAGFIVYFIRFNIW